MSPKKIKQKECKICGKAIGGNVDPRTSIHENCAINDVIETIIKGESITTVQLCRIYRRGYTVGELREIAKEREVCY